MECNFPVIPIFRNFRATSRVHPKFKNEIPKNVCFIRSPTLNLRNVWSNGKGPKSRGEFRDLHSTFRLRALRYCNLNWVSPRM